MSYEIQGAIVNEPGITKFAIVMVKPHIIQSPTQTQEARNAYRHIFPGMPIILLSHDAEKKSTLCGRKDIVNFLMKTDPHRIPWRRYVIK